MLYYIIIAIVVIIVLSYAISTRNKFDKLRRAIKAETSNIGIYKTKREDCLHDLMSIAKTSHDREVKGIENLTAVNGRVESINEKFDYVVSRAVTDMATFVGSTQGGILGSLLATLGVVLPSFLIILAICSISGRAPR